MNDNVKFITEAKVYLIGKTESCNKKQYNDTDCIETFLSDYDVNSKNKDLTPFLELEGPGKVIEFAGRLCYMSFSNPRPGGHNAFVQNILESGHGSVLEHANFTFVLTGISRSLSHQLVRHRAGFSYSQLSQRYVDSSNVAFVVPPTIQDGSEWLQASWKIMCLGIMTKYRDLLAELQQESAGIIDPTLDITTQRKVLRQTARSFLPNCTETRIVVTANARAWRHFIELRGSKFADTEIRRLTFLIYNALVGVCPSVFSGYTWKFDETGKPLHVDTDYRKV